MTAARYDPDTGSLYWRGTNERWVFQSREEAGHLLAVFSNEPPDCFSPLPDWKAVRADFVRDLTAAITAYDNDIQEEIAA